MGAGSGTRMFPLTHFINKHLLHLGGKPVIRIIVDNLLERRIPQALPTLSDIFSQDPPDPVSYFNLEDITIVCNKRDEQDYKWEFRDLHGITFHPFAGDDEKIGTAKQFLFALLSTKDKDNVTLLHYGDTITDLDYGFFIKSFTEILPNSNAMIAVTRNIRHDYSKVDATMTAPNSAYIVESIEEKPLLDFPSWTGIAIFKTGFILEYLLRYPENQPLDFGFNVLPDLARDNQLHAYEYAGRWFDVGNLRSYQKLVEEYQDKDLKL